MVEHKEAKKKNDSIEIPVGKYFSTMTRNPWIISTLILAVVLVVFIFLKSGSGASISSKEAGDKLVTFINGLGNGNAEIVSSEREGSLYKVTVSYQGQNVPVFVSLDGKYLISQPIPLDGSSSSAQQDTGSQQQKEVPKSDKPKVELFVMSYCPYGTQMEKGILPVLSLLKNKIDFTLRYTHFTLHGEKEDTENFRQLCIREEQGTKFMPYIQCILNSTDLSGPANVTQCMKKLGIDSNKVQTCMGTKAKDYYAVDSKLSQGYGVQGSPTLVINGVEVQSGRSPAAVLSSICSVFNNAPAECTTQLPSETPGPGFGFNTASASEAAAVNCGL